MEKYRITKNKITFRGRFVNNIINLMVALCHTEVYSQYPYLLYRFCDYAQNDLKARVKGVLVSLPGLTRNLNIL